jgi:hypothetical protein
LATETIPAQAPQTPEEIEREWFENVYAGDRMPQLTLRAMIMGMLLGMIMACSNVYVGLKVGWSMGSRSPRASSPIPPSPPCTS